MKDYLKSKYPRALKAYYFFRFYIRFFYRKQVRHHIYWKATFGDKKLYKNLNLSKDSVFFDIGANKGSVTYEIYKNYKCNIYSFEPDKNSYKILSSLYKNNDKVQVYNFALSNYSGIGNISSDYGSSSIKLVESKNENTTEVDVKNICEFIKVNNIKKIDVLKLNVEGSEFEILNILISSGLIDKIQTLIIQFHNIRESSVDEREKIIQKLKLTHKEEFSYYFVWEKWNKKIK